MKNKILSISFCLFIFGFGIANVVVKDKEISTFERRVLNTLPDISLENFLKGDITNNFESYALDHFVLRDTFRQIKAFTELNILNKNDYNNFYTAGGYIFKIPKKMDIQNTILFSNKINALYDKYLSNMNVYYSLIPDKSYYYIDSHLDIDFDKASDFIRENINNNIIYIDIKDNLSLESYYYTDIHWKQEKLMPVVEKLSSYMKFNVNNNYDIHEYKNFYGSYYGSLSFKAKIDTLSYLTNDDIQNAIVKDYDSKLNTVYEVSSLGSIDSYDVFLGGATPLIEIENTISISNKELIIFRDSFASSLSPLLIGGYKKITLVDLRYMSADLLPRYIEFNNQDVLFLYNMEIVLNSDMLKI